MKRYDALRIKFIILSECPIRFHQWNVEALDMADKSKIFNTIRQAIDAAPEGGRAAEIHLQSLKYAEELEHVTGKEFAHSVGIKKSYGTEFNKMKNIVNRPKAAGFNLPKI